MSRIKDYTGHTFHKITVLGISRSDGTRAGTWWNVRCFCGNEVEYSHKAIASQNKRTCGCGRKIEKFLVGSKRGKLTIDSDPFEENGKKLFKCSCECGSTVVCTIAKLSGDNPHCGCVKRVSKDHRRYVFSEQDAYTAASWRAMVMRCTKENHKAFQIYGAVGITVCDRWLEPVPQGFFNFLEDMGHRPEGTSLNRINGATIYSKETCEWATNQIQGYDQKRRNTNTSGKTGVSLNKRTGRWEAYIDCNGRKHLGHFDTVEEAIKVREAAEIEMYGWTKE